MMLSQKGHRKRLRERYLKSGSDGFLSYELLELLLQYAIPMKDTKELAKELLAKYGSLSAVLNQTPDALMSVKGVGIRTAVFLNLIKEVQKLAAVNDVGSSPVITTDNCINLAKAYLDGGSQEHFYIALLDKRQKLLSVSKLSDGSLNAVDVKINSFTNIITAFPETRFMVLMHNHPSGSANPSVEDCNTTNKIAQLLSTFDITVLDHIIVTPDNCVSFRERNLLPEYR